MYWFSGCFALFLLPQIPFCFLSSHIDNYWFALLPVASQEMKEVRKSVKFTSPTRAECVSSLWEKTMFSFLRDDFPQPLVFSKRVIPVVGRHRHNCQIHCAVSPAKTLTSGNRGGKPHILLMPGYRKHVWLNLSDTAPLPWHSLCREVSLASGKQFGCAVTGIGEPQRRK